MVRYVPKRGDIVWLDFDPQKGSEIKKTRPALVISPYEYNLKTGLALFMPISTKIKGYPFEVLINSKKINGAALSDQIRSLDWRERDALFICEISEEAVEEVLAQFLTLLN